jgi:hypothetical protein
MIRGELTYQRNLASYRSALKRAAKYSRRLQQQSEAILETTAKNRDGEVQNLPAFWPATIYNEARELRFPGFAISLDDLIEEATSLGFLPPEQEPGDRDTFVPHPDKPDYRERSEDSGEYEYPMNHVNEDLD